MKHTTKGSLLLLAAALLCACGDSATDSKETAKTPDTSATETAEIKEAVYPYEIKDYDGYTFKFLNVVDDYWAGSNHILDYEEEQADSVASAVYKRNREVEDDMNIQLEVIKTDIGEQVNQLKTSVLASDNAYDIVYAMLNYGGAPTLVGGYQLNMHDIETLHLSDKWWNRSYIEDATIGDNVLYTIPDYVNLMGYCYGNVLYFNKDMMKTVGLDMPYDAVRNGTWTYETLFEACVSELISLNGDVDYKNPESGNCVYGISVNHEEGTMSLLNGAGSYFMSKDKDNLPTLNENQDRLLNVYDKLKSYLSMDGYCVMINTDPVSGKSIFLDSRAAFFQGSLGVSLSADFRNMENEYGLLPLPKYDEKQESYHTMVSQYTLCSNIPMTAPDPARTGNILDYMAYKSYNDVIPVLQEALCYKGVRDDDSIDMLNILLETQTADIGFLYNITGSMTTTLCSDANLLKGKGNFASTLEKNSAKIEKEIEKLLENLEDAE